MSTIYIIQKKNDPDYSKLGSTHNFLKRMALYITPEKNFDNSTHNIWKFKIIKSKYTCYEIDLIVQYLSKKINKPYMHYDGTGGIEHYFFDNVNSLCDFFDKLDVEYKMDCVDVDALRNDMKKLGYHSNNPDVIYGHFTDSVLHHNTKLSNETKQNIETMFTYDIFCLYRFQKEIFNEFISIQQRLYHLIIAPTGTGKTVIFTLALLYKIHILHKDVIIISKRKEILDQMITEIPNNMKKIIDNKIVDADFTPKIINCIKDCSIDKLNTKNEQPSVYIVNFDKFTSTSIQNNYDKINFNKFGLIIVDESHWCGANGIYEFMNHIKQNTSVDVIGLSATPLRCQKEHRERTEELFSSNKELNILYEYSYSDALIKDKIICPIQWKMAKCTIGDFEQYNEVENDDDNCGDIKTCRKLKNSSYGTIIKQINDNILNNIASSHKGIMWFRQRIDLMEFYKYISNNGILSNYKIYCTMTFNESNDKLSKLVKECGLTNNNFESGINDYLKCDKYAILLAVGRACEGFNDPRIDFAIRMYYSTNIDPLLEMQRMGRLNRLYVGKPVCYYVTLEIQDDIDELRKNIMMRLKSWIMFARSYNKSSTMTKQEKIDEIKTLVNQYTDIKSLDIGNFDIESEILKIFNTKEYDTGKIHREIIRENKKRNGVNVIDRKCRYDEWALNNGYPICDELEEIGFKKFSWLFSLGEYLEWNELKKLCVEYGEENNDHHNVYAQINNTYKIPPMSMLREVYPDNYKTIKDLFSIDM
jgi:superfamily II DNA or RNA helicase